MWAWQCPLPPSPQTKANNGEQRFFSCMLHATNAGATATGSKAVRAANPHTLPAVNLHPFPLSRLWATLSSFSLNHIMNCPHLDFWYISHWLYNPVLALVVLSPSSLLSPSRSSLFLLLVTWTWFRFPFSACRIFLRIHVKNCHKNAIKYCLVIWSESN